VGYDSATAAAFVTDAINSLRGTNAELVQVAPDPVPPTLSSDGSDFFSNTANWVQGVFAAAPGFQFPGN
jgi:hypothetical protein